MKGLFRSSLNREVVNEAPSDRVCLACACVGGMGGVSWNTAKTNKSRSSRLFSESPSPSLTGHIRLTHNHQDKEDGGDARGDVEHESEAVPQLNHVVHVGHKHGREEEAGGTTQLQQIRGKSGQIWLHGTPLAINLAARISFLFY